VLTWPENAGQFLNSDRACIIPPQAIILVYNSETVRLHVKVESPRVFHQFGELDAACQEISRSRLLTMTIHSE
jgi:hypothetical protein